LPIRVARCLKMELRIKTAAVLLLLTATLELASPEQAAIISMVSNNAESKMPDARILKISDIDPSRATPSTTMTSSATASTPAFPEQPVASRVCAKGQAICIPSNYSKFDLPNETLTVVHVGIDIKDIPKIDDQEYSITLNAFFVVRWTDKRMLIDKEKMDQITDAPDGWIPVDVSFIKEFWLPDAEILNLKEFKTLDVLSKLEGLWLNSNFEIMYAVATRITFICPMMFNSFPLDVQVCHFKVGSFNYPITKMVYRDEFIADEKQIRSVLDYNVGITELSKEEKLYSAITGTFSVAGFELTLKRKVSHYIITYYLPSGMFVIVSWISFLVPPDIVPGRMTLLVTVFLVLVNIFNTITTNIPKAEGLTAIEAWVIVCVLFVFGALIEYAGLLLKMKLATTRSFRRCKEPSRNGSLVLNGNGMQSSAEEKMAEKKIMRAISRRRQKERKLHHRLR